MGGGLPVGRQRCSAGGEGFGNERIQQVYFGDQAIDLLIDTHDGFSHNTNAGPPLNPHAKVLDPPQALPLHPLGQRIEAGLVGVMGIQRFGDGFHVRIPGVALGGEGLETEQQKQYSKVRHEQK